MNDEIQKIVEVKYKYKKRVKIVKYFFGILIVFTILSVPVYNFYSKWKIQQNFVEFKIENPNDEIEIINKALKIYLDKMHRFHNFNIKEMSDRGKYFLSYHGDVSESNADLVYENCHGDKKHDDKCEFMTFDKRLDLEYLMKLGERICINGKPIENAEEIIKNDEILQNKKLFYPQDEKALVDENGNFITNFFYEVSGDKYSELFYGNVFINKDNFPRTNKDFDIIISSNAAFTRLFFAIEQYSLFKGFCREYENILTKFDENLPYYEDHRKLPTINFSYIPIKLTKNGAYDILTIEDIAFYENTYGHDAMNNGFYRTIQYDYYTGFRHNTYDKYDILFNHYKTLKNNNFNKNLNLQGDGNARN